MQITVRQWFRRYAKAPIFVVTAFLVLAQVFFAVYSFRASSKRQESSFLRIADIVGLGIEQKNRTLVESALGVGTVELGAKHAVLCELGRVVISIPLDSTGCTAFKTQLGYRAETVEIKGQPKFHLKFEIPYIENAPFFVFSFVLTASFLFMALFVLNRMQRKLKRDILDPLARNIEDLDLLEPRRSFDSRVFEISQMYKSYVKKLEKLKEISDENATNLQMAAVARTAQMVAHDVRRPFSLMSAFLGSIQSDTAEDVKSYVIEHAKNLEQAISSANEMMADILDFGTNKNSTFISFSVQAEIEGVLSQFKESLAHKKIKVAVEVKTQRCLIGHQKRLSRVFANLISNAIDAINVGGNLTVRISDSRVHAEQIEIAVTNSGSFVPENKYETIFQPFVTEGKTQGTGLGLAIVRNIVEAHGGRVRCESSAEPLETSFKVSLPAQCSLAPDDVKLISASSDVCKILVVEDELTIRKLLATKIKDLPSECGRFEVIEASDFQSAVDAVKNNKFDLIICDVELGENKPTGFEFLKFIRKENISAYVCIYSNINEDEGRRQALALGANQFEAKNLSSETLQRIISNVSRTTPPKKGIAVIDDDIVVHKMWKDTLSSKGIQLTSFKAPEEFFEFVKCNPNIVSSQNIIVTDYCFGADSGYDGIEIAKRVFEEFKFPIYMSTNGLIGSQVKEKYICGNIPKDWDSIKDFVSANF